MKKTIAILFDFNRTIYNPENNNLYEDTLETLKDLYKHADLYLVSKKELGRNELIDDYKLNTFFKRIYLVEIKTEELFKSILHAYNDKDCFVVGDLITSEISIGNKIGIKTIQIMRGKFKDMKPLDWHQIPNYKIQSLSEIKKIVS